MPKTPSQHCDEFDLVYVLGKHGWSDLYLIVGGKVHEFQITHVMSDPIEELIDFCASLIDRRDCWIRLHDEPGATLIQATTNRAQRHLVDLSVFSSDGWDATPEAADLQVSLTTKSVLLINQILYQLEKVQALCDEKSYASERSGFPHRSFRNLTAKWRAAAEDGKSTEIA